MNLAEQVPASGANPLEVREEIDVPARFGLLFKQLAVADDRVERRPQLAAEAGRIGQGGR